MTGLEAPLAKSVRGKFITVEGIDGAGKSSHLDAIAHWVEQQGYACVKTREPGGTVLGEAVRELVLHTAMQPMTELLLVFAARAEHVRSVILPALERGDWVLSDRFTDATRAYQGGGRQVGQASIDALADLVHADCHPDLTLVFDVAPEQAAVRVKRRGATDRFESEKREFADRVRAGYLAIAAKEPTRCKVLDGSLPLPRVRENVLFALSALVSE
jgi:dTMP kinase